MQPQDSNAQVGIGTLIIFIAMVLVAAIGAGVLIETAGTFQSQSLQTGQESQESVTNQLQILSVDGNVFNQTCPGDGTITLEGTGAFDGCIRVEEEEELVVNKYQNDISGPDEGLIFGGVETGSIGQFETISLSLLFWDGDQSLPYLGVEKGSTTIANDIELPAGIDAQDDPASRNSLWDESGEIAITNTVGGEEVRPSRPDDKVTSVNLTVRRSPGADAIDLRTATVAYRSDETVVNLNYSPTTPNASRFTVHPITDDDAVLEGGERVQLQLNTWLLEPGQMNALTSGETASIKIMTDSSTPVQVSIRVPTITDQNAVQLAP